MGRWAVDAENKPEWVRLDKGKELKSGRAMATRRGGGGVADGRRGGTRARDPLRGAGRTGAAGGKTVHRWINLDLHSSSRLRQMVAAAGRGAWRAEKPHRYSWALVVDGGVLWAGQKSKKKER